jgi:dipeptidyl aminopeptidase/acylaminoacyl peptidase
MGGTPLAAENAAPRPPSAFQAEDLFRLSAATDAQIRPDGAMVAYVRLTNDIMADRARSSIWLIELPTGEQRILPDIDPAMDISQPRWSPDGNRLAYVGRRDGGNIGIYVFSSSTGRSALLADVAHRPDQLAWSPDGRSLAFLMLADAPAETLGTALAKPVGAQWAAPIRITSRIEYKLDGAGERKPGYTHIFIVPASGGTPRAITSGNFEDSGPLSWTPDGKTILFTSRRGPNWERERDLYAIYRVSVADGGLVQLTANKGPETSSSVSPDGKMVAFTGYVQQYRGYENRHVYVMTIDGKNLRMLPEPADRSVGKDQPQWSADGHSLYVSLEDHGAEKVARIGLHGGIRAVIPQLGGNPAIVDRPYAGGSFSVAKDDSIAFTQGAPDHPSDVAIFRNGGIRRLTNLNADILAQRRLAAIRPLAVKSAVDGSDVEAWLVTPPGFDPSRRYPMILEIHGGPFASYGPSFATDYQLYAAAGYVVLYANPRGSTGYGEAFANGISHDFPGPDYDDLMSAVDAALAEGFIDPERLFVTGMSGGGALTTWIVGKTHRFKAAVAQAPPVDWTSEVLTVDYYPWMGRQWFGTQPWVDHDLLWKHSPLSLVGNVTTPTMLVVGDQDMRTPPSQAEEFYGALQLRGIPTTLIKIPGAAHGTFAARPSQSAARISAMLAWFARFDLTNRDLR